MTQRTPSSAEDGQFLVQIWRLPERDRLKDQQDTTRGVADRSVIRSFGNHTGPVVDVFAETVHDFNDFEVLRKLEGHAAPVYDIDLTPDGRFAASCDADGHVIAWDVASRRKSIAAKVSGGVALSVAGKGYAVWDLETDAQLHPEPSRFTTWSVAWTPDGERVAKGSWGGIIAAETDLTGHSQRVSALRYLSDERLLSGSWDGTLRLWNPKTGRQLQVLHSDARWTQNFAVDTSAQIMVAGGGEFRTDAGEYRGDGDYDLRVIKIPEPRKP